MVCSKGRIINEIYILVEGEVGYFIPEMGNFLYAKMVKDEIVGDVDFS